MGERRSCFVPNFMLSSRRSHVVFIARTPISYHSASPFLKEHGLSLLVAKRIEVNRIIPIFIDEHLTRHLRLIRASTYPG
jgi:hypothetical protein